MGIKTYNPVTPSLRGTASLTYDELTKHSPEKALTRGRGNKAGRNSAGRISVRRRGGGHKRRYRSIDFSREKHGVPAVIVAIEYDPNRSANIALLHYRDGDKRYILAPRGLALGREIVSGDSASPATGNALPLERIPLGSAIHNVELELGRGAQLVRAAGVSATVVAKENDYVTVKLPSGEMRMVFKKCIATIGIVGNGDHMNTSFGKAGRKRWLRHRPKVRGVVMNPVDHPHGGGEGRTSGGRHPVSPWGMPTKGYKTRKKRKISSRFIVKKRK